MPTLPPSLVRKALDQQTEDPWVFLWQITADISTVATPTFYLCNQQQQVEFPVGSGILYDPFPLEHGAIQTTKESRLAQLDLSASNVTRQLAYWVDMGQGFLNMPATLTIAAHDDLAAGAAFTRDFTIAGLAQTNKAITFRMEQPNYFLRRAPRDTYQRDRCRHAFKGRLCNYLGPLTDCNRSVARCIQIGDDEVANGRPRMHPRRFGAFPGLPRRIR